MAKRKVSSVSSGPKGSDFQPDMDPAAFEVSDADMEPAPLGVPGAKRPPRQGLRRFMAWVHGPPKIGKSTMASKFPGCWFWASEPGQEWLEVYEPTLITSWQHFKDLANWVEENKPTKFGDGRPINTIAFDTIDLIYKMCSDDVCHKLNIEDPSEMEHGKAWARVANEFERVMSGIRRWPYALIFISHTRDRPQRAKRGTIDRLEPDIGAGGKRYLQSAADLIMYAHAEDFPVSNDKGELTGEIEERRQLLCHPASNIVAGGRMSHLLPKVIPLDAEILIGYLTGRLKVGEE